ncbi:MAG: DUF975 family protein [Clostridiales bacterium]|nr:DUF975 family protein [Clostridiales bacterium]
MGNKDTGTVWSLKQIRQNARKTVFTKGFKPYMFILTVIFISSFAGLVNNAAAGEIQVIDSFFNAGVVNYDDIDQLTEYVQETNLVKNLPNAFSRDIISGFIRDQALNHTWLLNILAINHEYMQRNQGEVVVFLIVVAAALKSLDFLIKKTLAIGQYRYLMEHRFSKNVKFRRVLAPFSDKRFVHIAKITLIYNVVLWLWGWTIIGGIYKMFQYYFVPFIIAENPDVTWKEAKKLSAAMTKGYKFKLFLMLLSYFYLTIIAIFPFASLFVSVPVQSMADIEAYFALRKRTDIDRSLFVEKGFDGKAYVVRKASGNADPEPEFVLKNYSIKGSSFDKADKYSITDFIVMFFAFCLVGWVWEVGLHLVQEHIFVNRGFFYGPWLPIYGAGGAFIIFFLNRFKNSKPKLFIYTMLLCGVLEYLTSFALEFFNNSSYWNYDDMFFNLNGRVCLAGLIAFALGGFLGIYILGPLIRRLLIRFGKKRTRILCTVLISLFLVDLGCCIVFGPNKGEGVGQDITEMEETAVSATTAAD